MKCTVQVYVDKVFNLIFYLYNNLFEHNFLLDVLYRSSYRQSCKFVPIGDYALNLVAKNLLYKDTGPA
jgi:hypothetical protein